MTHVPLSNLTLLRWVAFQSHPYSGTPNGQCIPRDDSNGLYFYYDHHRKAALSVGYGHLKTHMQNDIKEWLRDYVEAEVNSRSLIIMYWRDFHDTSEKDNVLRYMISQLRPERLPPNLQLGPNLQEREIELPDWTIDPGKWNAEYGLQGNCVYGTSEGLKHS